METEDFYRAVENICGFKVLHNYYKIGEYRPLCGLLFSKEIKAGGYDYWGYSELDLIYGNIMDCIGRYLEDNCPVIGRLGHLRIVKNDEELNRIPFLDLERDKNCLDIETAYNTPYCCHFDEVQGMGVRYFEKNIKVIDLSKKIADIDQKYKYYSIVGRRGKWYFKWNKGCLTGIDEYENVEEFLYVHFQKRQLDLHTYDLDSTEFIMFNNKFYNELETVIKHPSTIRYTIKNRYLYYMNYHKETSKLTNELKRTIECNNKYCIKNHLIG